MIFLRALPLVLLLAAAALPAAPAQAEAPAHASGQASALIYATVTWPNGDSKTGFLRWKDEEAYWDDLFHCGYRDLVWAEHADVDRLRKDRRDAYFATHGLIDRLAYAIHEDKENPLDWRMFVSRIGDLQRIEINDGRDDFAITADGGRHEIGGYANDAGSRLLLYAGDAKPEEIRWNDLTDIVFSQAPADAVPYAERLYGTVTTTRGTWEGFIQWDVSECTTIDVLDGDEDDEDVEIIFGDIRSITRARDNSAIVKLHDGTERNLRGGNDVSSDNRGIMIETEGVGRVSVPWNRFKSLDLRQAPHSGPARPTYTNAAPLQGEVTDADGRIRSGRLVFDVDEAFAWDILNGTDRDGLDYNIPFHNVAQVEPGKDATCRVTLHNGQVLELGENQDTGDGHAGVLVFAQEDGPADHLSWSKVRSITFRP